MRIRKVYLKDFRGISEAQMDFDEKSIVLFGVNGSGKSSILQAVNLVFEKLINKVVQNRFRQNIKMSETDVRVGSSQCEISVEFSFNGDEYNIGRKLDKKLNKQSVKPKALEVFAHRYKETFGSVYDDKIMQRSNIPIFVNYGVNRLVKDIPLRIRKTHVFDPLYTYENAIQNIVNFHTFFEWYRNREDYENEVRSRDNPHYCDIQLDAVRRATEKMMSGFTKLRVTRSPLKMMICKEGMSLNVTKLSDGERCLLALIGDLARRASMANENPFNCEGIVVIDEIELHLHPTWQRRIVTTLRDVFPNIQFLISTHSPQVLSDIPNDMKVFKLSSVHSKIAIAEMQTLRGWDVNSILENHMETSSKNIETNALVSKAYEFVHAGNFDLAENCADELEHMTNNKNTDVIKLRFLISRGRKK